MKCQINLAKVAFMVQLWLSFTDLKVLAQNSSLPDEPTVSPVLAENNETISPSTTPSPTIEPTVNMSEPLLSPAPSAAPTNATEAPTATPSMAPTNMTDAPIQPPSAAPTISHIPTAAPTSASSSKPTTSPSVAPTMMAYKSQKATVMGITVIFAQSGEVQPNQQVNFQNIVAGWFVGYYDDSLGRRGRRLQGAFPTVRQMETVIDWTNQQVSGTTNTIVFTQTLEYETRGSDYPTENDLILAPWKDSTYNNKLANMLAQGIPESFASIVSPIALPAIVGQIPTNAPTQSNIIKEKSKPLSTGAIAGIAVGGAVVLLLLLWFVMVFCCTADRRKDDGAYLSDVGDSQYNPPSQFAMSSGNDDEISRMEDPTVAKSPDNESIGNPYGDQSVATVDYDYSKAYGGGGDNSVVSSVGGTLGDNTRQTAGDVAAGSAAARAALGASFESDIRNSGIQEQVIIIDAPAGKLGVVIDTPDDGAPVVHAVKDTSVIAHQIQVGDKLIAVDDEDVRSMTAIKVSKLISKKSANPNRRLTIVRTSNSLRP